jgi:hypothetical protein
VFRASKPQALFLQAWTTKTDEKAESELDGACTTADFYIKTQKFRAVKTPSFHGYVLRKKSASMLSNNDGRFDDADEDEEEPEVLHDGLPPELQRLLADQRDNDNDDDDDEEEVLHDGLPPELQKLLAEDLGEEEEGEEELLQDGLPPELQKLLAEGLGDDDEDEGEEEILHDGVPDELKHQLASATDTSLSSASFVDQLKLLPFLLKASSGGVEAQLETYQHISPPVRCDQFPQGVGCAAANGKPAWCWRVWDAAKAVALYLADSQMAQHEVVLELGAGAGLASLAALRLHARAVVATDLPRALPLLLHNLRANGGSEVSTSRTERGVGDLSEAAATYPRCPGGHALVRGIAACEDHVCNVCGLEDPLGGGIDEGAPVHHCRECDFDVCGPCFERGARGEWHSLPGWFKLQSEGEVHAPSLWDFPSPPPSPRAPLGSSPSGGHAGGGEGWSGGSLLVMPWDLLAVSPASPAGTPQRSSFIESSFTSKAEYEMWLKGAGKEENGVGAVVAQCRATFGAPPSLVVCADVSCSAALIQPLVDALVDLRRLLPAGSKALVCHEAREAAVDERFEAALALAALPLEMVRIPEEIAAHNSRLRMWHISLG